tara:strand:+ start:53 stop:541 length:489 start_codon:yes stop_codon:yes gene_type:complete
MYIINVRNDNDLDRYNNLVKKVPSIVMFYADWCGHCNNFKPHWNKFERLARKQHKNNDFMIARINEPFVNKVEGHSNVSGFPTIYHLMNGEHNADYEKQRDVDGLIEFLAEVHPAIQIQNGGKRKRKYKTKATRKMHKKTRKHRKSTKKHRKSKRRTERRRK